MRTQFSMQSIFYRHLLFGKTIFIYDPTWENGHTSNIYQEDSKLIRI